MRHLSLMIFAFFVVINSVPKFRLKQTIPSSRGEGIRLVESRGGIGMGMAAISGVITDLSQEEN